MPKVPDLRKTQVWQQAYEEGIKNGTEVGTEIGIEVGRLIERQQLIERLQANGKTLKEIAQLLGVSLAEVRRLANR